MSAELEQQTEWIKDNTTPTHNIEEILTARGSEYGTFADGAELMQAMKEQIYGHPNYVNLNCSQREALDMICHKIARIVNGNPYNRDSWLDISGYATLIVKQLDGENP